MASAYLSILPRVMIWFFNSWYSLFYLTHLNGRNRKQYFSRWSPCFGFFVYPCYNRRKHPTLEKPGAQNITEYENQGKQCELSDYWKPKEKKVVFEKKKQQEMTQKKKDKMIERNTSFNKSLPIKFLRKRKQRKLFKPINYWEIAANTRSD